MKIISNQWFVGVGVAVISGIVLYFILPSGSNIKNSGDVENSIQTIGQTGGINVIDKGPAEIIISANLSSRNVATSSGYEQVYDLCISNFDIKNNILVSVQAGIIGQPTINQGKRGFAVILQKGPCMTIPISFTTDRPITTEPTFSVIKN